MERLPTYFVLTLSRQFYSIPWSNDQSIKSRSTVLQNGYLISWNTTVHLNPSISSADTQPRSFTDTRGSTGGVLHCHTLSEERDTWRFPIDSSLPGAIATPTIPTFTMNVHYLLSVGEQAVTCCHPWQQRLRGQVGAAQQLWVPIP